LGNAVELPHIETHVAQATELLSFLLKRNAGTADRMTHGVSNGFFFSTLFISNRIRERPEISDPVVDRPVKDGAYMGEVVNLQDDFCPDGVERARFLRSPSYIGDTVSTPVSISSFFNPIPAAREDIRCMD